MLVCPGLPPFCPARQRVPSATTDGAVLQVVHNQKVPEHVGQAVCICLAQASCISRPHPLSRTQQKPHHTHIYICIYIYIFVYTYIYIYICS